VLAVADVESLRYGAAGRAITAGGRITASMGVACR